jgi:hypothetical protein
MKIAHLSLRDIRAIVLLINLLCLPLPERTKATLKTTTTNHWKQMISTIWGLVADKNRNDGRK